MEMNEKQAFGIIEEMIGNARREIKDNGFFYLLWGWLVLAGAIADYVMLVVFRSEYHALAWAVLMPLGGIITAIVSIREHRKPAAVKTYVDDLMKYTIIAFAVSLAIVCFIMPFTNNWRAFFPVLLLLYAVFLFISGGALRFKPLRYGAAVNWALAIAGFMVGYDIQLLFLAAAVLSGYIIPGYMLKARYERLDV